MEQRDFHFPSGGKYTKETAFWEASHFFSRDFLLWMWVGKKLHLRPEVLCIIGFLFALLGSWAIVQGHWWLALVFVHCYTALDCADGALARYTKRATRPGRFLDVICDGVAISALTAALAWQLGTIIPLNMAIIVGVLLWLSVFLQCSTANYANLLYAQRIGNTVINSCTDERIQPQDQEISTVQRVLHYAYAIIFGWQDRLCARLFARYTQGLRPEQIKRFETTTLFLSLHSFFYFGIVMQIHIIASAMTSVTSALTVYFALSIPLLTMLLHAKMTYAKQTHIS
jgi:hypothetical protein